MNSRNNIALNYLSSYYPLNEMQEKIPISFKNIKNKHPNRAFFITNEINQLKSYFNLIAKDIYLSLAMTFSLDVIDLHEFKRCLWPVFSSGTALLIGDYITAHLSESYFGNNEYDFIFKFTIGIAILAYCMIHRITDKPLSSIFEITTSVTMEILSIFYLYTSVFNGSRMLFEGRLTENYSLITSLGFSTIIIPGFLAHIAEAVQGFLLKKLYKSGAQRSDTAFLTLGLTSISNTYFQLNHFLLSELLTGSRLFQLGLISDNIFHTHKILQRFKNLPALLTDIGPALLKKLIAQQEKIEQDRKHNIALHTVLRTTDKGTIFVSIPRYQLRKGDLVWCNQQINLESFPLSGEIFFLKKDEQGQYTTNIEQKKFSINLKAHNGEDNWIEIKSNTNFNTYQDCVDLHSLHKGQQAGILAGAKLNLYGADNCFIQIKPEKKYDFHAHYEKKSVINQIINERKQKNVVYAMLAAITMASFLKQDITNLPSSSITLLFNLFQTMIPFSEAFLREMINSRLLKTINAKLHHAPLETIDALRIVDLCNALGGYYQDKFPNGVAIISDKTGTLTTSTMEMKGCWTKAMPQDVSELINTSSLSISLDSEKRELYFEVFASAYTNESKEVEPEEHAILAWLLSLHCQYHLNVQTIGNHRFKKILTLSDKTKEIETFHLGLFRSLGGRLSLISDNETKYLIFCGIPKHDTLGNYSLFTIYDHMVRRKGVLSRDWCIARCAISDTVFDTLKDYFLDDNKSEIENFLFENNATLASLSHIATFIINNPIKPNAENFIDHCHSVGVPVFVATGDTIKAAENIANVLCKKHADSILTIKATDDIDFLQLINNQSLTNTTLIFGGMSDKILNYFNILLKYRIEDRPIIIFAEMSATDKGILSKHLTQNQFFVVANGDGSNDVMMMRNANVVITHLNDELAHAPGVDQFSNLSDRQLRQLLGSNQSFYDLFDIHHPRSLFVQTFTPLANSQEKPMMALALKNSKMSFEIAKYAELVNVSEMPHQHWYSVAFDLIWLCISFQLINTSADLPADRQHLNMSTFINQCLIVTTGLAFLQAFTIYFLTGESTNLSTMMLMLCCLPLVLKSIFSAYGEVQNEVHSNLRIQENQNNRRSFLTSMPSYIGSFFQQSSKPIKTLTRRHQPEFKKEN